MTWNTKLTNIYNLASLHSWISQIDEMIINFTAEIGDDYNEVVKYLVEDLKSEHSSIEHDIISLVLLNYFEYSALKIIDLANEKLYEKISENDINFFKKHLFSGNLPLSSDLSYDITNRSFLSPKKAIKKAMQIDSVISKENPMLTVLYMCFILSRMDMNEENRAMVAFLLLRIDMDLPPGLQQRVYKYLWEYKDIIQELLEEEKDGPVILENIQSLQEKISSVQIIEKREDSDQDTNILNIQSADNKSNFKITNPDMEVKEKITANAPEVKVESTKLFPDKTKNNRIPEKKIKDVESIHEKNIVTRKKKTSKLPDNEKKIQSVFNSEEMPVVTTVNKESMLKKTPNKNKVFSDVKEQAVFHKKESNNSELIKDVENFESDKTLEKEIENKKKSWNITLKRNKDILESILNGIFKNTKKKIRNPKISDNSSEESGTENNIIHKKNIIKHKIFYTGVGFFLILGFFIYLAVGKHKSYSAAEISSVNTSVSAAPVMSTSGNIASQSRLPIPKKSELSVNEDSNIPVDFPFSISIEGNNLSWKVSRGDSITGLFYALKNYKTKLIGTPLEKLSNMDWTAFFDDFKKNNPKRKSYHIIFPSETFVLSLD